MSEVCALCLKKTVLKESHIIPKFVGKWMKDNGTGYLVSADNASKRVQDIMKIKLLCKDCEQKFSKLENYFADNIFYLFHNNKIRKFDYNENLKPFIISMAWRCLQFIKDDFIKENQTCQMNPFINKAEKEWREFLNNEGTLIDSYETHLIFLDYIESPSEELDPKLHWYLLHSIDFTIGFNDKKAFFYVKLPWMLFIISIEPKKLEGFEGTIVNKTGHITTNQTIKDGDVGRFLLDRAKHALHSSDGPSPEISEKRMEKVIKKDPAKFLRLNTFESYIVERDNVRRIKMKNMPESLIELVEEGILDGKTPPDIEFVNAQRYKEITRRIADSIADLSDEDAQRLHAMICTVKNMAKTLHKNKSETFTSESLYLTYMVSFDSYRARTENIKKEIKKLKEKTHDKIHCAVFSLSPRVGNYMSSFFVLQEIS